MNTTNILSIAEAVQALRQGQVIIYPTETFYAIGGDAFHAEAVKSVFTIKQRSAYFPLPLIVPHKEAVNTLAAFIPETAVRLMELFWPGPLTLLLPARQDVPSFIVSGSEYVAVRWSPHEVVQRLAEESGCVLTASSANISGFPPASHPSDISADLVAACAGIVVDQPFPQGGAPSTVVRIESVRGREKIAIRRAGAITKKQLADAGFTVL